MLLIVAYQRGRGDEAYMWCAMKERYPIVIKVTSRTVQRLYQGRKVCFAINSFVNGYKGLSGHIWDLYISATMEGFIR